MATASKRARASDVTRFEVGVVLLALGGVVLLISLFLDWYEPGRSAWRVFEVWDLVLAAAAVVALWAAAGHVGWTHPLSQRWLLIPGISAFVIVFESLLNHPPAAVGYGPMFGIWLALLASIVMIAGAAMSIARVSVAIEIADSASSADAAPGGAPARTSRFRLRGRRPRSASEGEGADPAAGARVNDAAPAGARPDLDRTTEVTRALGEDPGPAPPPG